MLHVSIANFSDLSSTMTQKFTSLKRHNLASKTWKNCIARLHFADPAFVSSKAPKTSTATRSNLTYYHRMKYIVHKLRRHPHLPNTSELSCPHNKLQKTHIAAATKLPPNCYKFLYSPLTFTPRTSKTISSLRHTSNRLPSLR